MIEQNSTKLLSGSRPFLLLLVGVALLLSYFILRPFFNSLVFAAVIASFTHRLGRRLTILYNGRSNLAALSVVLAVTFLIILPILFFIAALAGEGVQSFNTISEWLKEGHLQRVLAEGTVAQWLRELQIKVSFLKIEEAGIHSSLIDLSRQLGQLLLSKSTVLVSNITTLVANFFIMLFVLFYFVRDGHKMMRTLRYLCPLNNEQEERIINGIRSVARSVFVGGFLTAVVQGLVGGIGLALVGIPALFWGAMMAFASLVPIVGTAMIWIPATIYLLLTGQSGSALFLALWSIIFVGSIDNFLRPFLMHGQAMLSPFLIFLAILGGISYFGLAGILYGPLIVGFTAVMLTLYANEYQEFLRKMS